MLHAGTDHRQGPGFLAGDELSRKMVHKHWWKMLFFLLVLSGVLLGGFLCCGIGIFIAAPVAIAAFMYAYEEVFGAWVPASSMGGQPIPAAAVYGPAGTMVVPNAVGTPPPMGGTTPPPIAGATPPLAGGGQSGSVKPSRATFALITGLLLVLAVISGLAMLSFIMHAAHSRNTSRMSVAPPATPESPEPPPAFTESDASARVDTGDYSLLVNRIRQELEKISIRFDGLQLASSGDNNLVVSFTRLRKQSPGGNKRRHIRRCSD